MKKEKPIETRGRSKDGADIRVHPTAEVSPLAKVGKGTLIWHLTQVREDVTIGENCILGKNVYVDFGVSIGSNVKIQNNCSLFHGTTIKDGVFIGPHVVFTNDKVPRAINLDGSLKRNGDWEVGEIVVKKGASIGANSIILPGVTVGEFALIGAGSVVTKDIPSFALAYGNPAQVVGYVCKCGKKLKARKKCKTCGVKIHK